MKKFEVKDVNDKSVISCGTWFDSDHEQYAYSFKNTALGNVKVLSQRDYTHHNHPLMILLELSYDKNDVRRNNTSVNNLLFLNLCKLCLEDQEYFKPMFKLCTESVINTTLKELNNLIDYTEYWTGED